MFSLHQNADGHNHVFSPKFLSNFNKGGYTYQPSFTQGGDLLVSVRKSGENQNDIWLLSPSEKKIKRLTNTKSSEFYPRMNDGGLFISYIKKEQQETIDQQVFRVELKSQKVQSMTKDIHDVGNYAWISSHELGLYRMDNSLTYLETNENKSKRITTSVGKSISTDKSGRIMYVHKFDQDYYYLKKYFPSSSQVDVITVTPGKAEDFSIAPDGTIFMSKDHMLYSMNPSFQNTWNEVADLSLYDIKFITGLCISADGLQLALVATKEKP
ncbi:MAG: hypothetical protein IPP15_18975 [Saprospiraceae bacterium]|uniref:Uncharacterized protein n=1 Tax=Candidatus Opimibacter skivensis TaxID=2982028 RepID=A0A9D7SW90_9BACT|nr:hypothetical protein [Candidatus Opimibacter skivensis]